jgi:hypothetical protein
MSRRLRTVPVWNTLTEDQWRSIPIGGYRMVKTVDGFTLTVERMTRETWRVHPRGGLTFADLAGLSSAPRINRGELATLDDAGLLVSTCPDPDAEV